MAAPEPQPKPQFETFSVDTFAGDVGDVILELRLPRETLAIGAKVPVSFMRRVPCATCAGRAPDTGPACTECERGYTKVEATAEVDVPAGSGPGMQLRVSGAGHVRPDKPPGDVVVVLARAIEQASPAAQKLPSFILLIVVTFVILALALRMAR